MKLKLSKKDRLEILEKGILFLEKYDDTVNEAIAVALDIDSKLGEVLFELQGKYIENLSILVGDKSDWVSWYVYDNEYGKNELEFVHDGVAKKINNTEDLLWVIDNV